MAAEQVEMHQALEEAFGRIFSAFEGSRFERRSDLVVILLPGIPVPQFSGAWVCEDSKAAAAALPEALAEVDAAGEWPWVQTRLGHDRIRRAAFALGLTHTELVPGMVVRPDSFVEVRADIDIGPIAQDEVDETNRLLAASFNAPIELFSRFSEGVQRIPEARWYVARAKGRVVSTAVGFAGREATGIFNVATPSRYRGRGYGAAVTSHALREGFDEGSRFGYLQSSTIGHGVYRRLGFCDVEEYTLLTRPLAHTP
ncbi:MAG TPA: GNAT family N-acetyltransferase [Gaiellaceae bacterium]|nr:GNAT family N-acetyltransferase [Gaiellaceae bacterium]